MWESSASKAKKFCIENSFNIESKGLFTKGWYAFKGNFMVHYDGYEDYLGLCVMGEFPYSDKGVEWITMATYHFRDGSLLFEEHNVHGIRYVGNFKNLCDIFGINL